MSKKIMKEIYIDPLKTLAGRVKYQLDMEWCILDTHSYPGVTKSIESFFSLIKDDPFEPKLDHVIFFITIVKRILLRNTPNVNSNLIGYKVLDRYKKEDGKWYILVQYEFD